MGKKKREMGKKKREMGKRKREMGKKKRENSKLGNTHMTQECSIATHFEYF